MPSSSETGVATRLQQLRSGKRVNSRVPVTIEWLDGGQSHADKGYTIDISTKGCLAVVPQGFPVGQRLRLVNMVTNSASDAVLVWRGHEGRSGWELGLELQDPPDDFWGLDF